jgi:uncharacterized protein (DUF433 family)
MPYRTTPFEGIVHGNTIELEQVPDLPEGQHVRVTIRPSQEPRDEPSTPEEPPAWLERLDVDPAIAPGKLLIKGTRLLAEDLARLVEEGRDDDDLHRWHPELTSEDWDAIRNYARLPHALRRSFGAWAEDADELDRFLEEMRTSRRVHRRGIEG